MLNKSLLVFLFVAPVFSWAQTQYTVRKGDTLLKIADKSLGSANKNDPRRYEVARKIRALNPDLKNPNALEVGQTILIPGGAKESSHEAKTVEAKIPPVAPTAVAEKVLAPSSEVDKSAEVKSPAPEAKLEAAPEHTPAVVEPPVANPVAQPVVQTPPPAEAAKPQEAKKQEASVHHNFLFVQPRYQTLKIKTKEITTGEEASMTSKSSAGVDLQYGVVVTDRVHVLFQAGVTTTQFKDIEGDGTTTPVVDHKSETLKSFGLGVGYQMFSRLTMDFMLIYADRTFLLPEALPDYKLHAVAIPGAELNFSLDLYQGTSNIVGVSAIGEFIGALKKDHIEYKSTVDPVAALYWKSNRGHDRTNYKVTLMYKHGHQDTDISKQKEDLGVLGVGFYFYKQIEVIVSQSKSHWKSVAFFYERMIYRDSVSLSPVALFQYKTGIFKTIGHGRACFAGGILAITMGIEIKRRTALITAGSLALGFSLYKFSRFTMIDKLMTGPATEKMPVLFIGHGSPMNAIEVNPYTKTLNALGKNLPQPKAILVVSAHWMTEGTYVTEMQNPKTIHDFYGFPQALFDVQYPAPGSPEVAQLIKDNVLDPKVHGDKETWGLDHGTWSVLRHMYPQANIPVLQLSIYMAQPPEYHVQIGKQLAKLREHGVLILGSGNLVHNLRQIRWEPNAQPFDWAVEFDAWIKQKITDRDFDAVLHDFHATRAGQLSVPSMDHYYPMHYILGATDPKDELKFEYEEMQNGSISMRSFRFG